MGATRFSDVRRFPELDSTNRYLLDQARGGAAEGLVAVADHQSAGRGRLGRRWEAPPGSSLLVSVLMRPRLDVAELHLAPSAMALAAIGACGVVAGVEPDLKWPNDLVVGDRKLAGILAEVDLGDPAGSEPGSEPGSEEGSPATPPRPAVVVGMGLNLEWPGPPEAHGTSLRDLGGDSIDRDDLLAALLQGLEAHRADLDTPAGRSRLVVELRHRCCTLGRRVRVDRVGGPPVQGEATDITERGRLVIDTGAGRIELDTGDVVHLRPAASPEGTTGQQ